MANNAVTYLQIDRNGGYSQEGTLRVVKATAQRPSVVEPDAIVVRVDISVPQSAFGVIKAKIEVPEYELPKVIGSAVVPV